MNHAGVADRDGAVGAIPSKGFVDWLALADGALAVTTYQAGKVVLLSFDDDRLHIQSCDFPKPMGLAVSGQQIALACQLDVVLLVGALTDVRHDTVYLPHGGYVVGDHYIHDLAFGVDRLWMVDTRYSCVSTIDGNGRARPCWRPAFISRLLPQDRCHLNGLAMHDGRPAFVTAHAMTDAPGAWRAVKSSGGAVISVETGQPVVQGLCMPHSPRRYRGRWWLLNSGRGELCTFDPASGRCDVVCALPGYVRGLCFYGRYAVVGLSRIRSTHVFEDLPIQKRFAHLHCGLAVIDIETATTVGRCQFTDECRELYDVQWLPHVRRPAIYNQAQRVLTQTHRGYVHH